MYADHRREVSIAIFLVVLVTLLSFVNHSFATVGNFRDITLNSAHLAIASLGMLLVMLIGQIDISVGAILAICSMAGGSLAKAGVPIPLVVIATIIVGALLGGLNGVLVTVFRVHSIVVTLGTLSIYRGLLILTTGGSWIYGLPPNFAALGQGRVFGVPNPVLVMFAIYALALFLMRSTSGGRAFFATGSNPEAARLAGINVNRVQILAFTLNGALVGVAALLFASRFAVVQSNTGIGFEFAVITAVLVGGANVFGGSGSPIGTLLGAFLIGVLATALVFLGVNALWEPAVQGVFILAAVVLDRLRVRRPRFFSAGAA